jgi:hypothetical protein
LTLNSKENFFFLLIKIFFFIKFRQQLDDIQKVLSYEQIKFNEECSKLQHDTHEKWMEVKRLTRELDTSKKECEGLRRQYDLVYYYY